MEIEEAKNIVDEIKRLRLTSDEKISNFLQSRNILTVEDKLKIFQAMAANLSLHIDRNFLINHSHEVASDSDEFAELLLTLSQKNGTASLSKLADLYSKSPDMALGLYNRLINKSGQGIATPVAYILQGIGRRDTDKLLQLLDSSSDDPYLIIGQIGALRMLSFEQRIGENQIQRVMQQLGSSNSNVRVEALHFLLTAQIDIMGAMEKLMELTSSGDIETKRYIAGNCYEICRKEPETALKLLTKLSEFDDVILLNRLTFSLGCIGSIYPVQCLKMIQRWYRKDLLRNEVNLDWLPEQIGKGESKEVNGFLLSWIADEDDIDILTFNLPPLICHIFERNDKSLFAEFLNSANLADKKQVRVISKAVEMILEHQRSLERILKHYGSEQKRSRQLEQDFTDISFDFTCKLAQSKGIDYTKIEAGETDRLRRTLAIMDAIGKPRSEVDFTVIQNNLKYCPNIVELLKQKWFDDRINRRDATHPLMSLLEFKEPDYDKIRRWSEDLRSSSDNPLRQFAIGNAIANELEPLAQLEYIDEAFGLFLKGEQPKTKRLRRGFGDAGGFYPTLGELILSAHFKSSYPSTEIEYKVSDNRPVDCKVDINGVTILVEIISPEMSKELKYVKTVVEMENRATEKIKEEKLKKQIPDIAADTACSKLPIFLAINTTRGIEIDDIDVENSLYDISQDPTGKLLSGIIHYRMHFDKADYQMKLQGYIHKNPSAERSVSEEVIDNMRNGLFNKPLTQ